MHQLGYPFSPRFLTKLSFVPILILSSLIIACRSGGMNSQSTPATDEKKTYGSVGVVTAVDIAGSRVTIDHEDIPGYMAAMEMNEPVADTALLIGLKVGDKVEFEILRDGAKVIYTKFNKIGEVAILNGSEIYKLNCAECHGGLGEGTKKGIPLTSGHALDHSESDHIKQVADGKAGKMPAFKDKLSPEQIKAVVSFVRNSIQGSVPPEKRKGHHH